MMRKPWPFLVPVTLSAVLVGCNGAATPSRSVSTTPADEVPSNSANDLVVTHTLTGQGASVSQRPAATSRS